MVKTVSIKFCSLSVSVVVLRLIDTNYGKLIELFQKYKVNAVEVNWKKFLLEKSKRSWINLHEIWESVMFCFQPKKPDGEDDGFDVTFAAAIALAVILFLLLLCFLCVICLMRRRYALKSSLMSLFVCFFCNSAVWNIRIKVIKPKKINRKFASKFKLRLKLIWMFAFIVIIENYVQLKQLVCLKTVLFYAAAVSNQSLLCQVSSILSQGSQDQSYGLSTPGTNLHVYEGCVSSHVVGLPQI